MLTQVQSHLDKFLLPLVYCCLAYLVWSVTWYVYSYKICRRALLIYYSLLDWGSAGCLIIFWVDSGSKVS